MYKSYLRAFDKYAQSSLGRVAHLKTISRYASIINSKANQLIQRATENNVSDLPVLQKALFESGRDYVRKFSELLKKTEVENSIKKAALNKRNTNLPG